MFRLLLSISGKEHRKITVIETDDHGVGIWFIASGFQLFFCKKRLGGAEDSQQRAGAKVVFFPRSGLFIMGTALFNCRFVFVIELGDSCSLVRLFAGRLLV